MNPGDKDEVSIQIGDYLVPTDPADIIGICDGCQ